MVGSHVAQALVTQTRGSLTPDVDWLHIDSRGMAWVNLSHFGTQEADATLVIADTAAGAASDRIRVKASLIDVGDNNGIT